MKLKDKFLDFFYRVKNLKFFLKTIWNDNPDDAIPYMYILERKKLQQMLKFYQKIYKSEDSSNYIDTVRPIKWCIECLNIILDEEIDDTFKVLSKVNIKNLKNCNDILVLDSVSNLENNNYQDKYPFKSSKSKIVSNISLSSEYQKLYDIWTVRKYKATKLYYEIRMNYMYKWWT